MVCLHTHMYSTHTHTHTHRYCHRLWIGCYHSLMSATEIRRSCDCNGRLLWRYEYYYNNESTAGADASVKAQCEAIRHEATYLIAIPTT